MIKEKAEVGLALGNSPCSKVITPLIEKRPNFITISAPQNFWILLMVKVRGELLVGFDLFL